MRKQFRGAMLALAALAGIVGNVQVQRVNSTQAVQQRGKNTQAPAPAGVNASVRNFVPARTTIWGSGGNGPVWNARAKRGNRCGRSRWDYGR